MYQLIESGVLEEFYEIDPKDSWVLAACEKNLPIFTPGWEDSTLGNIFVANAMRGDVRTTGASSPASSRWAALVEWYKDNTVDQSMGFFQIGGGIAGDFPICVVPLIQQDLRAGLPPVGLLLPDLRQHHVLRLLQRRRAQREDHLGQAGRDTPRFVIESDASIVAPLIFAYILGQ